MCIEFEGRGFCTEVEASRCWCVANTYLVWIEKLHAALAMPNAKPVRNEEFSCTVEYTWADGSKTHEIYTFVEA